MKPITTIVLLTCLTGAALGQVPVKPELSAAEKTAFQALETQKRDAQNMISSAQQQENLIEREFSAAHPGFYLNPVTLAVEGSGLPAAPKHPAAPEPPAPKK